MELKFKTFEKQRVALRYLRDKTTNEVLYGGGARGGKSWLGCGWVIMESITKPGSAWMIAREEAVKLKDTTLLTFFMVAREMGINELFHYNAQSLTITFSNGSLIFFREIKWLPSDPQFDRLGSYDLTGCFLDECQQIHAKAINVLRGRFSVLKGKDWQTMPKSLYTCNPSKNWIYEEFIKPEKENRLDSSKVFVRSLATDNPFISQDYIDNLKKSDPVTVQRLLYGNFEYDDDPSALIDYDKILDCFTNDFVDGGDGFISCDVARFGSDTTIVGIWMGWRCRLFQYKGKSVFEVADIIREKQQKHKVPNSRTIADEDGVGGGVVDILRCKGFVNNSRPLPNPLTSKDENYANLKSQCYFMLAEKINKGGMYVQCNDPSMKAEIIQELEQVKQYKMDKDGKKTIMPKDKVKEIIGRSPDYADTLMMRMWFELSPKFEVAAF